MLQLKPLDYLHLILSSSKPSLRSTSSRLSNRIWPVVVQTPIWFFSSDGLQHLEKHEVQKETSAQTRKRANAQTKTTFLGSFPRQPREILAVTISRFKTSLNLHTKSFFISFLSSSGTKASPSRTIPLTMSISSRSGHC